MVIRVKIESTVLNEYIFYLLKHRGWSLQSHSHGGHSVRQTAAAQVRLWKMNSMCDWSATSLVLCLHGHQRLKALTSTLTVHCPVLLSL